MTYKRQETVVYKTVKHTTWGAALIVSIAFLSGCSSSTGDSKEDLTPPPVPTNLMISKIDNGSATLSWNAVYDSKLEGYYVYWLGGTEIDIVNANRLFVNTNTVTIAGLDYEILYFFAVSSVDKAGNESALSDQERGKPLNTTSPAPPGDVDIVGENIDYPKISVYWAENTEPDVAHYNLYRALTTSALADSASFVTTLTQENYIDIEVEIGTTYYYSVTAVDKGGWESAPSLIVSDYVLPKVALISPVDFEYTTTAPTFNWQDITGVKKYNIVVTSSRIGGEIWNVEIDQSTTQIVYSGKTKLISGNTYYWKVGAISRVEVNSISDVASFVVKAH